MFMEMRRQKENTAPFAGCVASDDAGRGHAFCRGNNIMREVAHRTWEEVGHGEHLLLSLRERLEKAAYVVRRRTGSTSEEAHTAVAFAASGAKNRNDKRGILKPTLPAAAELVREMVRRDEQATMPLNLAAVFLALHEDEARRAIVGLRAGTLIVSINGAKRVAREKHGSSTRAYDDDDNDDDDDDASNVAARACCRARLDRALKVIVNSAAREALLEAPCFAWCEPWFGREVVADRLVTAVTSGVNVDMRQRAERRHTLPNLRQSLLSSMTGGAFDGIAHAFGYAGPESCAAWTLKRWLGFVMAVHQSARSVMAARARAMSARELQQISDGLRHYLQHGVPALDETEELRLATELAPLLFRPSLAVKGASVDDRVSEAVCLTEKLILGLHGVDERAVYDTPRTQQIAASMCASEAERARARAQEMYVDA